MFWVRPFRDWSIRHKLTGLFIAMAFIVSITVSVPMGIFDLLNLKRAMARDLATLADVLAGNSTAALAFRDAGAARDVLQALRAEPSVTAACIYTQDGQPFARYVRRGSESPLIPSHAERPVTRFEPGQLIVFRDVAFADEAVGTIYIASDLRQLDARLRQHTLAFVVMLAVTLSLAFVIASRLQRPISQPLAELVQTTEKISSAGDYRVRAQLPNRDEFGMLVSAFNGMLDQIEKRDAQLRRHREELEQEVASRTEELLGANLQLRRAEEKYRTIFEDAVIGIFQTTPDGRPLSINRALAEMHGYDSPEQLLAEVDNVAARLFVDPRRLEELRTELERRGVVRSAEVELYRRDGTKKWGLVNLRGARNAAGEIILHEGTVEDITDRKRAEEQVQFLAYYDALTGLPNRTLLRDRLEQALASARRRSEKVAVLFIDLDRFKIINDSLGHSVGDLLLQEVAERLKTWGREQDTVARIGGDEFLIALTAIKDVADVAVATERIMSAMTPSFSVQSRSFTISCSVGNSMFPDHGFDSETLIMNADAAMYCAKEAGRNRFQFFTDDMNAQVVERLTLEHSLRVGLDREELFLVYQPQANISDGRIVGFEALLRWQHPELGLVSPERFIRVAENSGLIIPIGEWALRMACSLARKWQDEGLQPVPIAVNVSAVQFRQDRFRELIRSVLDDTGLAPQYLELELTESLLLTNADVIMPLLRDLKTMGVKLAIDDFGTGYSSLSYLRHFPVNKLKVDRSFIQSVAVNSDDAAITAAIISMAKSLNLKVIAEGVENEAQMSFLRAHHCDEIQGYYCSAPLTVDKASAKLRSITAKNISGAAE